MTSERKQILEMLAAGTVSVDEAERLLQLIAGGQGDTSGSGSAGSFTPRVSNPKYIRVIVEPTDNAGDRQSQHHVNVRVPLKIIRAGVNLASLIPGDAGHVVQGRLHEKGFKFDISKLDGKALDKLIEGLQDLSIDVIDDQQRVRVFVE